MLKPVTKPMCSPNLVTYLALATHFRLNISYKYLVVLKEGAYSVSYPRPRSSITHLRRIGNYMDVFRAGRGTRGVPITWHVLAHL